MAIQKKSLIGNLSATKKAIVATNATFTAPVSGSTLETAKKGGAAKGLPSAHLHSSKKGPAGKRFTPSGKTFTPSGKTFTPSGKTFTPSGKTFGPSGKTLGPSGKNIY